MTGLAKNPEDIPFLPDALKDLIKRGREAGKDMAKIIEDIKNSPIFKALPQDMQNKILTVLGSLVPVDNGPPTGPSNPGGAPTETPEQYKKKIIDIATKFMNKLDPIDVEIKGEGKFLTKKVLSTAIQANYTPYGA